MIHRCDSIDICILSYLSMPPTSYYIIRLLLDRVALDLLLRLLGLASGRDSIFVPGYYGNSETQVFEK